MDAGNTRHQCFLESEMDGWAEEERPFAEFDTFFFYGCVPGTSGVQHFPAALAPSGWQAGALMRNVAMTNKMKSVGEALQGFLETAVPSSFC